MVEDGDPIPKPGGAKSYRRVMKDLDVDHYLLVMFRYPQADFSLP